MKSQPRSTFAILVSLLTVSCTANVQRAQPTGHDAGVPQPQTQTSSNGPNLQQIDFQTEPARQLPSAEKPGQVRIAEFADTVQRAVKPAETERDLADLKAKVPRDFAPWWQASALQPMRRPDEHLKVDVNSLIIDALRHSARVRAISDNTVIAETAITRADAEFDVYAFMESKFVRTSVPTGSTLDAGFNVPRLRENDWFYSAGLRRKNRYGGRIEVAQKVGTGNSNSNFFFPPNQGNSRLTLSYNQPLLNGAGEVYNTSLTLLASLNTHIASSRTAEELQDHLLEVTQALWQMYLQRAALLQKKRHLERSKVILRRLEKRRGVDSLASQIARARAAVAKRGAELIRAVTGIQNAESRVRALVNAPDMLSNRHWELVTIQPPMGVLVPVTMKDALLTALENRPEIDVASREIESARVLKRVSRNELLPVLNVVLESYVSGLRGDSDIGRSWTDQFSAGEPSFTAGLVFEVPLNRRAAKAQHRRRRLELRQLTNRFRATVETVNAEVEVAVREVETAYRELQSKYVSMVAAETNRKSLQRRWESMAGDKRSASFLLEDLLDAQERLANEEFGFVQAQVKYTLSLARLKRATGTLLKHEQVQLLRSCEDRLPTNRFEKRDIVPETPPPPADE